MSSTAAAVVAAWAVVVEKDNSPFGCSWSDKPWLLSFPTYLDEDDMLLKVMCMDMNIVWDTYWSMAASWAETYTIHKVEEVQTAEELYTDDMYLVTWTEQARNSNGVVFECKELVLI